MRRSRTLCSLALLSVLWLANAGTAHAAAVWSVLSVNVEGDPQPWLGLAKQVNALRTRLKLPTVTIVQATLAGDVTGTYFVSTEYPSLTALGEATAKVEADPEWPGLLKQLQAASKVVSSELYVDRTPAGAPATPLPAGGYGTGIVVRVDNASAYFALLPKLRENFARLRVPVPRVWQATLAGPRDRNHPDHQRLRQPRRDGRSREEDGGGPGAAEDAPGARGHRTKGGLPPPRARPNTALTRYQAENASEPG